ncbi:MAG: hypothetical protein ACWGNP_00890 [Candidatus Bathyarchaeia archaeon]
MHADLFSTQNVLIFLVIIVAVFMFILLLPTILELRKPKDAGPRKITEEDEEEN